MMIRNARTRNSLQGTRKCRKHQHDLVNVGKSRDGSERNYLIKNQFPSALFGLPENISDLASVDQMQAILKVWDESELAVSVYPRFQYSAIGAGGPGIVLNKEGSIYEIRFNESELQIPALDYKTTRVLGIPIPPPLKIEIITKSLKGTVDASNGKAELEFLAEFQFSVGELYKAPALIIQTTLTTESSIGNMLSANGSRLSNGRGKLVGVARVPKTEDWFLNAFLMLPTDALAQLAVEITIS